MIDFAKYTLENGLRLVIHEDKSSPMVAVNVVYDVGSRDEDPNKTGFAHLFEHLMFGGSQNVPDFDGPIQNAGGENNAFTNTDMTNFYNVLPAENIETALWLESDRMKQLDFSEKILTVQKKVVIEEFKETCLAEPYGDVWHHLADLAYENHSYKWPTIGKTPAHIENAQMDDVVHFFNKHYTPNNAIIVISGNMKSNKAYDLVNKWFGDIPAGNKYTRSLTIDAPQRKKKQKLVKGNVPLEALYLSFHMVDRCHADYYAYDLLSDVLSNGRSSRLFQRLYKEKSIFSQIDAYISGTFDPGMFVIEGRPMPQVGINKAKEAVWNELELLKNEQIDPRELQKLKNKIESSLEYSEVNILHKSMSLAYFELLGDANLINKEAEEYQKVTSDDIQRVANTIFKSENCSELIYQPNDV
ncbi:MAG: pitrilysin family protein [Saprospiraceae bacterium]|nr:pitrilysin family protein [Saprospiraceae bacterium]